MAITAMEEPKKINGIDKWEVEDAARTLRRTFEIKQKPKLLSAALGVIRKEQMAGKQALGWAGALTKK